MTIKKPTEIISDAIGDGEVYSEGDMADVSDTAPQKPKKPALNKNQRRRKNAAKDNADQYIAAGDEKPKKAAASGSTKRIAAADKTAGEKKQTAADVRKAKQEAEQKLRPKHEYSGREKEDADGLTDFKGLSQYFVTSAGRIKYWDANKYGLPEWCQVVPLGKNGDTYYFLDTKKQVVDYAAAKLGNATIKSLFSPDIKRMEAYWPVIEVTKETKELPLEMKIFRQSSWKSGETQSALMDGCSRLPIWDAANKVRGRGAWLDESGKFIYHCGDSVWTVDGQAKLGMHGAFVYPHEAEIPQPWDEPVPEDKSPGLGLLELFKTWNWARPELDPILLLGWLGASVIGGALKWRPMVFVTGDAASGKSTIQEIIGLLFGAGLLQTADTTSAGIYQEVKQSSLPIAIDELENDKNNLRTKGIIALAKLASSGAKMKRGGADHKAITFTCRSCFFLSAVLMPPLKPQDLSRMAILNLGSLEIGQKGLDLDAGEFGEYGQKIKRRMIDQWPHFEKVLRYYHLLMQENGHKSRAADQFGTLIAAAHVMVSDQMPTEAETEKLMKLLAPDTLAEVANNDSNAERCLTHLLQCEIANYRAGSKCAISERIYELIYGSGTDENNVTAVPPMDGTKEIKFDLASVGMSICSIKNKKTQYRTKYLAVGTSHPGVMQLFSDTDWKGEANSTTGWSQALIRIPGAVAGTQKIARHATRVICVPLSQICKQDVEALKLLNEGFGEAAEEESTRMRSENRHGKDVDPYQI